MAASPSKLDSPDHEAVPRVHAVQARVLPRPSFKECGCGHAYSQATWQSLEHRGVMLAKEKSIELRQCVCGSTLAVLLETEA